MRLSISLIVIFTIIGVHIGSCGETEQYPEFGRSMRSEFLLAENFIQLNHGSYGTYPKVVQSTLHEYQARSEANAELWIRRDARTSMDSVRSVIAQFLGIDLNDFVIVPNTTSGINAVLRSLVFNVGDKILHFSTIFRAMHSLLHYLRDSSKGAVSPLQFNVTYPISNFELVANFKAFVTEHHKPSEGSPIRLALLDHISSTPGVINPLEELIPFLKSLNILVLIDGAHAIGNIKVDLPALVPDFYITNCHKWLYSARGSAILYVDKKHQGLIHPTSISSNYNSPSRFQDEFFWTGTMDYSSYITIPTAIKFREDVGGEDAIRNYTHNLAIQGGNYLATSFGTRVLQEHNQMGQLVDVQLPIQDPDHTMLTGDFWINTLLYKHNVYATPHKHGGLWWIRVSAQIYNDLTDFEACARVFLEICNEVNAIDDDRTTTQTTEGTGPPTAITSGVDGRRG